MASTTREFRLVPGGGNNRRISHLLDPVFEEPLYIVDNDAPSDSAMVLSAKGNKTMGSVTATTSTGRASFTVTGAKDFKSGIISMTSLARMRTNHFSFEIDTPGFLKQRVEWKHTKAVPPSAGIGDPVHMKLVYGGTNNIIARFIHKQTAVHLMEGTFEMLEDFGPSWDLAVFMSCIAVLKYSSLMLRLEST